jgi:DNA-binding response OmpR family regulator
VQGLTLGGDDYMTKPFSREEVMARTRSVLGRTVFYRLSDGFPEPLRDHCLRSLVAMPRQLQEDD